MMRLRKCSVLNCTDEISKRYFFPVSKTKIAEKWVERINKRLSLLSSDQLKYKVVCQSHFEQKCIMGNDKLITNALPTLKLPGFSKKDIDDCFLESSPASKMTIPKDIAEALNINQPLKYLGDSPPQNVLKPKRTYIGKRLCREPYSSTSSEECMDEKSPTFPDKRLQNWNSKKQKVIKEEVKKAKTIRKKLRDGHRQALNNKKTTSGQAASKDSEGCQNMTSFTNTDGELEDTQGDYLGLNETDNNPQQITYSTPQNKIEIVKITEYLDNEQKGRDLRLKERDVFRSELIALQEEENSNEDNALKKFFDSMYHVTQDLPEYLQIKIQRQVFSIVMDIREENT